MVSNVFDLSSLKTPILSSSLRGVEFKQFEKNHNGGIPLNFSNCFADVMDFKSNYHTDFILTKPVLSDEILYIDLPKIEIYKFTSTIKSKGLHLVSVPVNLDYFKLSSSLSESDNYRACYFQSNVTSNLSTFDITFFQHGLCKISCNIENVDFYLVSDQNNQLFFINGSKLSKDDSINQPHHFNYIYQETYDFLTLFKETSAGFYYLYEKDNEIKMKLIQEEGGLNVIESSFELSRKKYLNYEISTNSSFITYNNDDNRINLDKSDTKLSNNFLIHKNNSSYNSKVDIMVLKNQSMAHKNKITNSNTLLSGLPNDIYVDNFRNYTSIFQDIESETNENLELNYVFHNKSYAINPGLNEFTSPSNMFPYLKININDTKLKEAGAFPFPTPEYADKVYSYTNDVQNTNNQHYLCTWLSGGIGAEESIWVDRYYYPDLIEKNEAIVGKSIFNMTYENYVETIINQNQQLSESINNLKFFDKRSDLVFEPNKKYVYDRVDFNALISNTIDYCKYFNLNNPFNYFKTINTAGQFTFILFFNGNNNEWIIKTDTNSISAGISVIKSNNSIEISYTLYENANGNDIYTKYSKTVNFKPYTENSIYIAFDSYSGNGYIMFNNDILQIIEETPTKYNIKNLFFGDLYLYENNKITGDNDKTNLLLYTGNNISDKFISDQYYDKNLAFSISINKGKFIIDELYVTLPCGMRNGTDNIDLLHTICGNTASKSNKINIHVKNLNINNDIIHSGLNTILRDQLSKIIPIVNDIDINTNINYK